MSENRRPALLDDWDELTRTTRRPPLPARVSSRISPPAGAVLLVLSLVLAVVALQGLNSLGISESGGATWGPLAVFRSDARMEARNEGTLVITADCTFLERDGERRLLAWPTPETTWDPASAQISFVRRVGQVVSVRNGEYVVLGGGGSSRGEDGLTGEGWADRVTWVARPKDVCLLDERFLVSDVMKEGPGPTVSQPSLTQEPSPAPSPIVRCAGVSEEGCGAAVALVRQAYPTEFAKKSAVVVADSCPPPSICDRAFPLTHTLCLSRPMGAH